MEKTEKIWMDGKLVAWEDAKIHVLTHTLHYGSGVFEGIRFYKTDKGPAIFRLHDHMARLFHSASTLEMKVPFSVKELEKGSLKVENIASEVGNLNDKQFYICGPLEMMKTMSQQLIGKGINKKDIFFENFSLR